MLAEIIQLIINQITSCWDWMNFLQVCKRFYGFKAANHARLANPVIEIKKVYPELQLHYHKIPAKFLPINLAIKYRAHELYKSGYTFEQIFHAKPFGLIMPIKAPADEEFVWRNLPRITLLDMFGIFGNPYFTWEFIEICWLADIQTKIKMTNIQKKFISKFSFVEIFGAVIRHRLDVSKKFIKAILSRKVVVYRTSAGDFAVGLSKSKMPGFNIHIDRKFRMKWNVLGLDQKLLKDQGFRIAKNSVAVIPASVAYLVGPKFIKKNIELPWDFNGIFRAKLYSKSIQTS